MLTAVLLVSGVVGTAAAALALPAGSQAASIQHKKPRPRPTTAPSTVAPTPEPSTSPTPPLPPQPGTPCAADAAVAFQGSLYCPGQIVGVQVGVYGAPSRVVLQGVTVVDVSGTMVQIMGGPACLPDPAVQEPQYCGATLATMEVDFAGSSSMPAPDTSIDLYGVTNADGRIEPDGFITVAWCDPDTCP